MADRITFTRPAAERIGRAVRIVEAGSRVASPWQVGVREHGGNFRLQVGTFTGDWQTGEYKVVTLSGSTNTASVYNWCNPALGGNTAGGTQARYVIFGAVNGTHSAVEIQMRSTECTNTLVLGSFDLSTLPGYVAGEIQLLGHSAGSTTGDTSCTAQSSLSWYSITTCATATA